MRHVKPKGGRLMVELDTGYEVDVEPGQARITARGVEYGGWHVYSTLGVKLLGVGVADGGEFVIYYKDVNLKAPGMGFFALDGRHEGLAIELDERRGLTLEERRRWT